MENEGFSCTKCTNKDNMQMVQCDNCDAWFHYECVGVNDDVASESWSCTMCKGDELTTSITSPAPPNRHMETTVWSRPQTTSSPVTRITSEIRDQTRNAFDKDITVTCWSTDAISAPQETASAYVGGHVETTWQTNAATTTLNYIGGITAPTSYPVVQTTQSVHRPLYARNAQSKSNAFKQQIQLQILEEERNLQQTYLEKKFKILTELDPQGIPHATSAQISDVNTYGPTHAQLAARYVLPKDLPTFNGDHEEWPIFISSFENSTRAAGYSHVENLIRLQASLKGKAREVVRNKLLIPAMVPDIIKTLKMYFGRPEHIIHNMVEKARKIPPLKDKLESIIEFSLCVNNICATMEACKMIAHLSNPMLVHELVEKLPNYYKLQWAMYPKDEKIPVLKNLGSWLYQVAEAASQVVCPLATKRNAVINTHVDAGFSSCASCVVCKGDHKLPKCNNFIQLRLDQKWQVVKDNKICRQCLNNHRRKCYANKVCGIEGCRFKHHPLLHKTVSQGPQVSANENSLADRNELAVNVNTHRDLEEGEKPYFRIIPIRIHTQNKFINTFAFLDEGSSVTLIEKETFDNLGLEGVNEPLCLKWTGDTTRTENSSKRASIIISNPTTTERFTLTGVHTTENLGLPRQTLDMAEITKEFPYLAGLPISSYHNARPTILIGVNNWKLAVPMKIKEGARNQPIATKTRLGWALQGNVPSCQKSFGLNVHICQCEHQYKELHEEVKSYFALESSPTSTRHSKEDERALEILNSTSKQKGDRFEIGLLWRSQDKVMPESYPMAYKRFMCLEKKLEKEPSLRQKMRTEIAKLLSNNYARKLNADEIAKNTERVWYLPIFVTASAGKPDRVRLVWDGAAKSNGVSLNDFLLCGPDLLTPLVDILLAFRTGSTAICGDIESMFHQIKVRDEDMHVQRFLWRDDGDTAQRPSIYVMSSLTFGINCAPCIAHYIRNKNADGFQQQYPRAVEAIKNHHYVDDFIDSVDEECDAINLATQVKHIHAAAGFNLRKWNSNSTTVLQRLTENNHNSQKHMQLGSNDKVLGMYWDPSNDTFKYILRFAKLRRDVVHSEVTPTKRETLQVLMSVFDPLGFLSCYTIKLKILLQAVWRSGIDWDDELPDHLQELWNQWKKTIDTIRAVEIKRPYANQLSKAENVQLHTFVDAGEYAYAAACYLRVKRGNEVVVTLVAAKSKVAPLKPVSIPRLELQAAVMGLRLASKIMGIKCIPISSAFWWSDSKTVLKWLHMDPRNFQSYVMHRVGEILDSSNPKQWKWVPSKLNVADFATKTTSSLNTETWFTGPEFLREADDAWPSCDNLGAAEDAEIRHKHLHISKVSNKILQINYDYFSDWKRLYRAIATFQLYIEKLRAKITSSKIPTQPSLEHLQNSKLILFRQAQLAEYFCEISCLKQGKNITKNSKLISLNIHLDEHDLITVRSRAEFLNNYEDAIVLPTNHPVTFLVVRDFHKSNHHISHETTINNIRAKFYIPKLRVLYKKIRSICQQCKNWRAVPKPPQMASLPPARLAVFERPFTFVGIDYFGPFLIIVGRRREKRWGVIFTCLTIRAIHIEVAHSLDTSSSIMCIRNFMSRRGTPREIYTDNGTNFKASEKIICEQYKNIDFTKIIATYDDIKWKFNPPSAPHMGGVWERLIRSIKNTLSKCSSINSMNDENFRSALLETEFIINSRPLTFVSVDSNDDEALTPNHLLLGSSSGYKPINHQDANLRHRWKQCQTFADQFWQRWLREYTPILTKRSKWFHQQPPIKSGDVVIIVDENLPRNCWPKGIVIQTNMAKDGQVRSATVKTQHGIVTRPAIKIAVLDVYKVQQASHQRQHAYEGENVAAVIHKYINTHIL